MGLTEWDGLQGKEKLQQGLGKGSQPGCGAVSPGQRLLAVREWVGHIPESPEPPPTSAQLHILSAASQPGRQA